MRMCVRRFVHLTIAMSIATSHTVFSFSLVGTGTHISTSLSSANTGKYPFEYAHKGKAVPKCAVKRRTTFDLLHVSMMIKQDQEATVQCEKKQVSLFSRTELLRASMIAGLISLAQPLLVAAASLAANQYYDRWWVFPLAPFGHKKTVVTEIVPNQVFDPTAPFPTPTCRESLRRAHPQQAVRAGWRAHCAFFGCSPKP